MTPEELIDEVRDFRSFLDFVHALADERRAADEEASRDPMVAAYGAPRGWQNADIASFLEAAAACAHAHGGEGPGPPASWRAFAEFLHGGKVYE
jgi:hypothetical protein